MYIDGDIEDVEMKTESGTDRRALMEDGGFISHGALERDNVPCSRPGNSYYNCAAVSGQANPYQRGCSVITQCARIILYLKSLGYVLSRAKKCRLKVLSDVQETLQVKAGD
ncbi:hypothetical protein RJ639_033777 [Escallonia herrerae]|uniref:Uncharacterized protein n=1 Tax=Escallonia herrerae TaxID=1293975 RepID=A0AA88WUE1_9ASTE|nr:hypothetical protein RJ639_033777 [Escallonia herrerae]